MSTEIYFAYLLATIVIVIMPGPTVTLIVANSLTHGTRAGLLNVAGTQVGLAVCIAIVAVGLASLVQAIGWWFDWLRIVGAAYLIWIGWKLIRSTGEIARGAKPRDAAGRIPAAGLPGDAEQSEDLVLLRRLHPAIHRSRRAIT